jgi:dihydrofolate reductase
VGKVVLDMTVSVNGCVAGPRDEPEGLHDWFFDPSDTNKAVIERQIKAAGAMVMGRRTYDMGADQDGFVDNPFPVEHFVVTRTTPDTLAKGDTSFTFLADVGEAVRRALTAAGDRDVIIGGGADLAQQCLAAGLVDEIRLAVRPVLIADGKRLFDNIGDTSLRLELVDAIETPEVNHLHYRVLG